MSLTANLGMSKYKSTREAFSTLKNLAQASGWSHDVLSRLAISRSLQVEGRPEQASGEDGGKELNGSTFFHHAEDQDYLPWVAAMIAQHAGRQFKNRDEACELVTAHWHRGLKILIDKKV